MVGEVVGLWEGLEVRIMLVRFIARGPFLLGRLTRKAALYGSPIGRFAKMARTRLARGDRKARLWEIS